MESAEASGKTVEDALERALNELGATREEVEMVVLDEGRRAGLFGRGGREATVRVTRLPEGERMEAQPETPDTRIPRGRSEAGAGSGRPRGARSSSRGGGSRSSRAPLESPQPRLREEDFIRPPAGGGDDRGPAPRDRGGSRGRSEAPRSRSAGPPRERRASSDRPPRERRDRPEIEPDINAEEVDLAATIVDDLLNILDINADITIREPLSAGDGRGSVRAVIDISGDDLGLLIGRRGDTLQALQYLVNLIVGRRYPDTGAVTIDVEHYRHRREEQIVSLAQRMADRVRQTHSPITLEPMPPAERRIVHLLFAEDPDVVSSSIGEGESRKVVISPRS
jgi:spoIIIJ-associated protein